MADQAVELSVAGQKCRVVSSADEEELSALAAMVEEKLARVIGPGRPVTTQAMILAAIALAHDARSERQRADAIAAKAKATIGRALERVEAVLSEVPAQRHRASKTKRSDGED